MAEAHWGPGARQATYHNQFDHGYAPMHRAEPPLVARPAQAHVPPGYGVHHSQMAAAPQAEPYDAGAPMVEFASDDSASGADRVRGGGFGSVLNYAGAAVSLALVIGLGVWGYKLAVRDVTGIPVVRALEGPMRVQPDNPGGQLAEHQGFAVNGVQSEGRAAPPADRLVLAPEPEDLAEDDLVTELPALANSASGSNLPVVEAAAIVPAPDPQPVDPVAAALAIAEQIAADATPLSADMAEQVAAKPIAAVARSEEAQVKIIPASVPGVRRSPRPSGRPADLDTRVAASPAVTASAAPVAEVAPDKIAVGTRLVQLGAFDSEEVARAEWDKLAVRFEDYLEGKSRVIQKAQSGGKTFYRLRAMGFEDLPDARRFCSVLMAAKAACIPVVTR